MVTKYKWHLSVVALMIILFMLSSGCNVNTSLESQHDQLLVATTAYSTTLTVLTEMRRMDKLSDAQIARVNEYKPVVRAALDAWRKALEDGQETKSYIKAFDAAVLQLMKVYSEVQGAEDGS